MPRNPDNNPTERIERLLLDFEETRHWVDLVLEAIPAELFAKLPPFPRNIAFFEESIRHRLNRSRVLANRKSVARSRLRRSEGSFIRGTSHEFPAELSLDEDIASYEEFNKTPQQASHLESTGIQDPFKKE